MPGIMLSTAVRNVVIGNALYLWFFLSGAAALIYEIAWQKMLVRLFGSSLYAVATITSVFLIGLSIGSAWGAQLVATGKKASESDNAQSGEAPLLSPSSVAVFRLYGWVEIVIALLALTVPILFETSFLQQLFVQSEQAVNAGPLSLIVRIAFTCVMLLPPTILMGCTFPLVVYAGSRKNELQDVQRADSLYTINTLGAVIGCVFAGFVLLPSFGLTQTCWLAAAINAVVGLSAMLLAPKLAAQGKSHDVTVSSEAPAALPAKSKKKKNLDQQTMSLSNGLLVSFGSGMIALMLQVSWTRWFQMLAGSSTYSMTLVLAFVLAGIAFGAWLVCAILRPLKQPIILASTALAICAIYLIIAMYASEEAPWTLVQLMQMTGHLFGGYSFASQMSARAIMVFLNVFAPSALMGTVVPFLFESVDVDKTSVPRRAGLIYAANTAGTVLGACVAGFVLIPALSAIAVSGIQMTILLSVLAQTILSFCLFCLWSRSFIDDKETRLIVNGIVGFVAFAVVGDLAFFRPSWNPALMSAGVALISPADLDKVGHDSLLRSAGLSPESTDAKCPGLLFYREGLNTTVSVQCLLDKNIMALKNDGKIEAAIPADPAIPSRGSDVVTHAMLGYLPIAVAPNRPPSDMLLIGWGSGVTCGAMLSFPSTRTVHVCELEPAVLAAAPLFSKANGNCLSDEYLRSGRVQVVVNDGRYVLLTSPKPYEAIVSQPAEPWVSGSSQLFSEQFWRLAKQKLQPDGVFCQWVQLYSLTPEYFGVVCRTFTRVFPNAILVHHQGAGECVLVGFKGAANADSAVVAQRFRLAQLQPVLYESGVNASSDVLGDVRLNANGLRKMCDGIAAATRDNRCNTDDNMLLEYAAARNSVTQQQNIDANIEWIGKNIK